MNLLPLTLIIILILGIFSLSQFQRSLSLESEKITYISYFKGLRGARNKLENSAYVTAKTPPKPKKDSPLKKEKEEEKKTTPPFFRDRKIGWPNGRLHLSSLVHDPLKYPNLEEVTLIYLSTLYGKAEFFPKDPRPFFKHLIKTLKTSEEEIPLHELELNHPEMEEILYKMLRGTQTYDLTGKGYPPFHHFFTFEETNSSPMNFHSANEVFLNIVLGEKATKALIAQEKEELEETPQALTSPIKTAKAVEAFLGDDFAKVAHLFRFSGRSTKRNPEAYTDQQTQITVRIE